LNIEVQRFFQKGEQNVFYLYKWANLKEHSPQEATRNEWLFKYGAFARLNGLWFPCKVVRFSTIGEPATVTAIPIATNNLDIYPKGEINADNLDVLYSVFANGQSIQVYIQHAIGRKRITDRMLNAALKRSLNTELLFAPKRLMKDVKKAANREDKEEAFVIETNNKDEIGRIELPRTIDIVEKLWNSNDWAMQELSQILGISYNPAHGKKERMLQNELLGDRDLTVMNREMITSRLINAAEKFGESVTHISTEIDTIDRQLSYGSKVVKESDPNADDTI
jgi:hypothetical protein